MSSILQKTHELEACPGFRILYEIRSVAITFHIFGANSQELLEKLRSYELGEHTESDDELTLEVMRQFHNYLASAKSLIDHTRRVVGALCAGHAFMDEYEERVRAAFAEEPLSRFIQDLRNYTLHRDVPIRGPSVGRDSDGAVRRFFKLDAESLRAWSKWSSAAKKYLHGAKQPLLVNDVVEAYTEMISGFHQWLEEQLREVFAREIAEEAALRQEISSLSRRSRAKPDR